MIMGISEDGVNLSLPRNCKRRSGPGRCKLTPIGDLLDEYYEARGWDINGIPTRETLKHVGLEDLVADMRNQSV